MCIFGVSRGKDRDLAVSTICASLSSKLLV